MNSLLLLFIAFGYADFQTKYNSFNDSTLVRGRNVSQIMRNKTIAHAHKQKS